MKLLFVTHWANNMLIFRTPLLRMAVERGHQVLVLCPADPQAVRFAELGVRHVPWVLRRGGGLLNLITSVRQARRILEIEKPDRTVVYCVQPIVALLAAWKLGPRPGMLFPTFTGLGSLWTDLDPPGWRKRLVRSLVERYFGYMLPLAHKIFVLNRDDKAQVASWNPSRLVSKVEQTKGEGVDLDHFRPPTADEREQARGRWGIPVDARVIGFVGRLIREKGAQDFLQLCRSLAQESNTHFLVVGDPDLGNPTSLTLLELAELDAVPRLHREPWMDDVRPAYWALDVLAFLSVREGLPITPLEAMGCGVPVVGYDVVGVREVLEERCNPEDIKELRKGIEKARAIPLDKSWARDSIQSFALSMLER